MASESETSYVDLIVTALFVRLDRRMKSFQEYFLQDILYQV